MLDKQRIKQLIQACSTEVVKRRVANAKLKVALEALQKSRDQFREYARQHRAKHTSEAAVKAMVNDRMADMIDEAMTVEINPEDMGRP